MAVPVEVRDLVKSYGPIRALRGVSLDVAAGEIHGLVGANGAGKSTLIRILAGVEQPDEGEVRVHGIPTVVRGPRHAAELGFSFIHQELNLVDRFTAAQNMELGNREIAILRPASFGGVSPAVKEVAARLGISFPLDIPVVYLTVHQKWLVAIARALLRRHPVIAMDEPTAALDHEETAHLLSVARELARDGVAILYVSHRLDEVVEICDRVTVFKDGAISAQFLRGGFGRGEIVQAIVGAELPADAAPASGRTAPEPVFVAKGLAREPAVRGVNLTVGRGELVGVAGLVGSGRTELARLIFGADQPTAGTMELGGIPFRPREIPDAVRAGVCYVPEERRSEGLFMSRSVEFNLNIATLDGLRSMLALPFIDRRRSVAQAASLIESLAIRSARPRLPVAALSGGNQQKVVLGKWLAARPRLLLLDEPSRGVDVGARAELYVRIRELAQSGMGVVVISSEFEELTTCDRVLVMREGRLVGELAGAAVTVNEMLRLCYA